MSIVYETLTFHLPHKRKQTPSGWLSFNAPCCVHNGTSADTRQRAGVKTGEGGGVSYHCFNCGFTASWKPGRRISYKMKRLMQWLNIPDDTITKISLQVLETEELKTNDQTILPKFMNKELPEGAKPLQEWADYRAMESTGVDKNLLKVFEYLQSRQLYFDDYNFHWSPLNGYSDRLIVPFYSDKRVVGYTARKIKEGIYECFINDIDVNQAIVKTQSPNLDLLPANIDLVGAELELINKPNREHILLAIVDSIKEKYDYIIIDCTP